MAIVFVFILREERRFASISCRVKVLGTFEPRHADSADAGSLDVIADLKKQLALPGGMAWIWWGVRTSFANPAKVGRGLEKLRGVIADLRHYRTVAAKRARQRRRASNSCQEMSPGMP